MTITELREMVGMLKGYAFGAHVVDWLVLAFCVSVVVAIWAIEQRKGTR